MPLLFGKLLATVVVTTVAASIAVALGTVMALIDEADQKAEQDRKASAESRSLPTPPIRFRFQGVPNADCIAPHFAVRRFPTRSSKG